LVSQSRVAVTDGRVQYGNKEEGEIPPLEAATKNWRLSGYDRLFT
jgi:hypothetical protein